MTVFVEVVVFVDVNSSVPIYEFKIIALEQIQLINTPKTIGIT